MVHGLVREVVRGPGPLDWSTDRGSVFSGHPCWRGFENRTRLNDVTDVRCYGIETKRDKRPLVSSNHNYDFVYTWRRNIRIALFILISLENMLYLET